MSDNRPRLLARFRRVTTSGAFIPEVDGLRFIAVFAVVLFHLATNLGIKAPGHYGHPHGALATAALNGFRGVELFFVISGFILGMPFAAHALQGKPQVNLKQYFLRRVTRLEPPYGTCMLILFALHVWVRDRSAHELFPHLMASLLYAHNLVYGAESVINNVAWSLEIEIQFYVLAPLLASVFLVRSKAARRAVLLALCGASIALGSAFLEPGQRASMTILRFGHFFLLGFLLVDVYLTDWKERPSQGFRWDLVSLAGWPLLFLFWNAPDAGEVRGAASTLRAFVFPAAVFILYCAAFRGRLSNRAVANPWIATVGGMCYTIYLLHNPALGAILSLSAPLALTGRYAADLLIQLALVTPLLMAVCAAFFVLVERPCMRRDWPRRLLDRLQSRAAAPAAR